MAVCALLVVSSGMLQSRPAAAQRPDFSELLDQMDQRGTILHEPSGVTVTRADFETAGKRVEAIAFSPPGEGPFAGLLLIPGYGTSARDWVSNGLAFSEAGYFCLAVTQPGFGGSEGPADFAGPDTIDALKKGFELLQTSSKVDALRLGIIGYSRGALAACLLATELSDVDAIVLGGGIYDFQRAWDEAPPGIRANMEAETGMTPEAVAWRTPLSRLENLTAAVLILHGEIDGNAPVVQAYILRDWLELLGKEFELKIFPGAGHSIGLENFRSSTLEFLDSRLGKQEQV